jgi:hypothetical protein
MRAQTKIKVQTPLSPKVTKKVKVSIFFILYFCVGMAGFSDYRMSSNERAQRGIGGATMKYIFNIDQTLLTFKDKYYGSVIEIFLVAVERIFHLENDSRAI